MAEPYYGLSKSDVQLNVSSNLINKLRAACWDDVVNVLKEGDIITMNFGIFCILCIESWLIHQETKHLISDILIYSHIRNIESIMQDWSLVINNTLIKLVAMEAIAAILLQGK